MMDALKCSQSDIKRFKDAKIKLVNILDLVSFQADSLS
jgi:hypothetical protein